MDVLTFTGLLRLDDQAVELRPSSRRTIYFKTHLEHQVRVHHHRCCVCSWATRSPTSWRAPGDPQPALLMLVMLPFWTSFLLRVYAWKGLLTEHGPPAS